MNKWTCEDCVKENTDACYFHDVVDGHKYCQNILVDIDYAYEKGRTEAIDELANVLVTEPLSYYAIDIIKHWGKKLKEKQDETNV